jgi:phage major head subunit gpT-like protein
MSVVSTGLNVAGLRSEFFARLAAITGIYWAALTHRVPTSKGNEDFRWLGAVPQMREWGTGRVGKGLNVEAYNIATQRYEATLEVDKLEIDRDQTGQIKIRVQELAQRAATHKDFLIGNLIKNGGSSGFEVQDGKTFFATDHEYGASGAQSNDLTFDISAKMTAEPDTPTTPSAPTIRRAFSEAVGTMASLKDDRGEPLRLSPQGLYLACTPLTAQFFNDALNASLVNNTTVQQVIGKPTNIVAFPELTNHAQFYVFKTDEPVRPFTFLDESPIEFGAQEQNSESGFMQEVYRYGVRAVYRIWLGDWRKAIRVTLA